MARLSIYPGTLWFKRVRHLCVIYLIGVNLFINEFQEKALIAIETNTYRIEQVSKQLSSTTHNFKKIEENSWLASGVDLAARWSDLPSTKEINEFMELGNTSIHNFEKINGMVSSVNRAMEIIIQIVKWTSFLIWIPIVFSAIWLSLDVYYGNQKRFTLIALLLAIPLSIWIYRVLVEHVMIF